MIDKKAKVDCNICKNKGKDCLMNIDGTCGNFKKRLLKSMYRSMIDIYK